MADRRLGDAERLGQVADTRLVFWLSLNQDQDQDQEPEARPIRSLGPALVSGDLHALWL